MYDDRELRGDTSPGGWVDRPPATDESPGQSCGDRSAITSEQRAKYEERLVYIARRRYSFREDVAGDLARAAVSSFVASLDRYANRDDQSQIMIGILRNKCREHIRRQICLTAQRNAIRDVMPLADVKEALATGALDDIAARDARKLILEAFADLRPKAREALLYLRDGASRIDVLDVIERLGLNRQKDAPRLSAYRSEFRQILVRLGIQI